MLSDHETKLNQDTRIDKALTGLRNANQRAASIITTLRNMFGNGPKKIATFDFNELVNDVLLLCQPMLQKQAVDFQVQLHATALNLAGEKSQLQQVLLNLITNAIEAFPPTFKGTKKVTVQTNLDNDQIMMTVQDNGSGIAPDIEASVFALLRTNKKTGMGVGLWLSKTIIDSHRGTISFTTGENRGTRFLISLPLTTDTIHF